MPEGVIASRNWLKQEAGISTHALDNLVKSEQLRLLWRGKYTRGKIAPNWQSVVHTLQQIVQTDFIVGGLSALQLKGFSHYLPNSNNVKVHLYGNDKLPVWANELVNNVVFVNHSRGRLFSEMDDSLSDDYSTTIPWRDNLEELKICTPERACLEMLNMVPHSLSFEHADQLVQGMTSLSPRALQSLLEMCSNIKVKRLFLWMARRHNYV